MHCTRDVYCNKMRCFKDSPLQLKSLVPGSEILPEERILNGTETDTTQIPYQVNNCDYFDMKESRCVVMKFESKLNKVISCLSFKQQSAHPFT